MSRTTSSVGTAEGRRCKVHIGDLCRWVEVNHARTDDTDSVEKAARMFGEITGYRLGPKPAAYCDRDGFVLSDEEIPF